MINHAGHTSSERLMNKKLSLTCIHTKSSVACGWNGWLLVARSIRDGETVRNTCGKRSGESEKENVCLKLSWRQPLVASELTWWYNPVDYNMPRVLRHIFSESVTSLIRYAGAGRPGRVLHAKMPALTTCVRGASVVPDAMTGSCDHLRNWWDFSPGAQLLKYLRSSFCEDNF